MIANYKDNKKLGPGHGLIVFSDDNLPEAPWSIALQRSSDQKYASGDGRWLGEIFLISPDGATLTDTGNLVLAIGPGLVDSLDQLEQYKITLKGGNGQAQSARLALRGITRSAEAGLDQTASPLQQPPKPKPAKPVEHEDGPGVTPALILPEPAQMAPKGKGRKTKILRYALIALLALICVIWAIVDSSRKKDGPDKQPITAQKEQLHNQADDTSARVRAFFKNGGADAKEASALAKALPATDSKSQDAVYRLYYFAAENGDTDILTAYAACLDPAKDQWGTIEKDAPRAAEIYRKAIAAGVEGADAALAQMRAWLQDAAAKSDKKAAAWLAQIPE